MRRTLCFTLPLLASFAALAAAATPPAVGKAARDGWPDSRPGAVGRRYVAAFNAGDEAMLRFYKEEISPDSLATRPAEKRLTRYHDIREHFGRLTFARVIEDKPDTLVVSLLDADAEAHTYFFAVEPRAPRKLLTVGMREMRMMRHGDIGGFHH